jgi:hypothetical protein
MAHHPFKGNVDLAALEALLEADAALAPDGRSPASGPSV